MKFSMSKKILLVGFLAMFIIFPSCSMEKKYELWNGFTEGMNAEQVREKMKQLFGEVEEIKNVYSENELIDDEWYYFDADEPYFYPSQLRNIIHYMVKDESYAYYDDDDYDDDYYYYYDDDDSFKYNICFRFYQNDSDAEPLLGRVTVRWNVSFDDVKTSTEKKYGKDCEEYNTYPYPETYDTAKMWFGPNVGRLINWNLNGKEIFVIHEVFMRPIMKIDRWTRYDVFSSKITKEHLDKLHESLERAKKMQAEYKDRAENLTF